MPVHRINHAVLFVRDVQQSVDFWCGVLEFVPLMVTPQAAFLRTAASTNDHDLGLFAAAPDAIAARPLGTQVALYHLAWEVDTLRELARLASSLESAGALVGASNHGTTKSLYAQDPDGLEHEICWLVPGDQIIAHQVVPLMTPGPLDLAAETARFGADTRGGVGLPVPLPPPVTVPGTVR